MADAARLALVARRFEVFRFTVQVAGIDLTGIPLAMQVRLGADVPGAPLIALAAVDTLAAEGLKLDTVVITAGVPTSTIRGRINKTTMSDAAKVPYAGEIGDDTVLAYAMQWTIGGDANTRIYGDFVVVASAYGSDNAPTDRPPSYGTQRRSGGASTGSLTFGDQIISVSIDGTDLLGPLAGDAAEQAARAEAAAAQALAAQIASAAFVRARINSTPDEPITFGSPDGKYALKVGAGGVDLVPDPTTPFGGLLNDLASIKPSVSLASGQGISFGAPDGSYALLIDAEGVHFPGQNQGGGDSAPAPVLDGAVFERTVAAKQQIGIVTGIGETMLSDGTANDRYPQIIGEHIRMSSDRNGGVPIEMRMAGDGTSVVSAKGSRRALLLLALGQSTSIGSSSAPTEYAITTVPREIGSVLRFNRGVRPIGADQTGSAGLLIVVPDANISHLQPLAAIRDSSTYAETHLETLAYRLFDSDQQRSIACAPGIGGASYADLAQGTIPYQNAMTIVQRAQDIMSALGWSLEVICTWDQGEANSGDSASVYKSHVIELYNDLKTDIGAITKQEDFHLFLGQTSSLNASGVPIGQWQASLSVANIHCVGPRYGLPYTDSFHFTSPGYTMLGDIYWRAVKTVVGGIAWKPLQPTNAVLSGSTITVAIEGRTGNLAVDTTGVPAIANYGLEYADSTNSATISSVTVGTSTLTINLSAAPTGANRVVRAAYTRPGALPDPAGIARTNICDSDTMTATFDGHVMPKRLVHFELPVT